MFFVEAHYHHSPKRAADQVRYIAHREEGLRDGERRELYGIGPRYRAFRGDEKAIRRALLEDARGLRNPVYFRFILTVDNRTAQRFTRLDGRLTERVLRDAVEKTFRGAARSVQGVFAVHQHGGELRASHPHVHALLSPRLQNRKPTHHRRRPLGPIGLFFLSTNKARRLARVGGRWLDGLVRPGLRLTAMSRNPERVARRMTFRLATALAPKPIREALWALRGLRGLGLRCR